MVKGLIAGLIAGVVGSAAWAALTYFSHREYGILAWGIGVLVGFAVSKAMSKEASAASGILAAVIALCTIAGGKYAAVALVVDKTVGAARTHLTELGEPEAKIRLADQLVEEYQAAGKPVEFAAGVESVEDATEPEHYPKELWTDLESRWASLSQSERDGRVKQLRDEEAYALNTISTIVRDKAFRESFDLFDVLWGFLAIASAYRLGSGKSD